MTKCACCGNTVVITNKISIQNNEYRTCIGCTNKILSILRKELSIEDIKNPDTNPMLLMDIAMMHRVKPSAKASDITIGINKETVIWAILVLMSIVIAFVKSESILLIAALIFAICGIIRIRSNEKKPVSEIVKTIIKKVIYIGIVCFLCRYLVYLSPFLAGFNYKGDIAELKDWHSERFYFFPDTIPKEAAKLITWETTPKSLRGIGSNQELTFYAEKSYLQKIYNTYADTTTVYPYLEEYCCWGYLKDSGRGDDDPDVFTAPAMPSLTQPREGSELLVIHENTNPDPDCSSYGGICINWEKGLISFWEYD